MNDKQKRIVIGAAGAVLLTLLFPPFHIRYGNGVVANLGFGFLFDAPSRPGGGVQGSVTVELLLIEWVAIAIVAGVLWWLLKEKP